MTEQLIELREAAQILGYSPSGLQKIVDRSRRGGQGPSIRYFQAGKGAPIKFRRSWIEDFIAAHTHEPKDLVTPSSNPRKPATKHRGPVRDADPYGWTTLTRNRGR